MELSAERKIRALQQARILISDPRFHSRFALWRDRAGLPVIWPQDASSYSIQGATEAVLRNFGLSIELDVELTMTVIENEWESDLERFNDHCPHELIMWCFELTIRRLRQEARELQAVRR